MKVTVVEALPKILPFLPDDLRVRVHAEAKVREVEIREGARVERVEPVEGKGVRAVVGEEQLEAALLVAATGVRPNAELAAEAGLSLGAAGSIKVDDRLYTSDPHILAAGDCADATHGLTGESTWIPLALRANRAGKLAGRNALGGEEKAPPVMGTAVFKFFDLQIARTGLSLEEARAAGFDTAVAAIQSVTRAHYIPGGDKLSVWLLGDRKTGKLLGGAMIAPEGAAHRIDTVVAALHAGLTADDLYDMDLAYAPPFGPSWSPLLTCASQLSKKLKK
jgi:NADPH-dependent 2,4-dienoyl-CoA reductase/sulfur reductase-like enzyme